MSESGGLSGVTFRNDEEMSGHTCPVSVLTCCVSLLPSNKVLIEQLPIVFIRLRYGAATRRHRWLHYGGRSSSSVLGLELEGRGFKSRTAK